MRWLMKLNALRNEVASAIITARSSANLTQKELAELMSAKQSLIARLEASEQNTTVKTLKRIAQVNPNQIAQQ